MKHPRPRGSGARFRPPEQGFFGLPGLVDPARRITLKVQRRGRFEKVEVTADGKGLASHAGSALLVAVADKVGLTDALSEALAPTRERRSAHDPGEVVRDLCVMLADGGDCLADLGALRDQEDLFGRVASAPTAWRVVDSLCAEGMLERLRAARAKARERVWELGGRPERIVLDLDPTLITAHSDKEEARGNFKGGFGFHPMLCYLDESEEALSGLLRPGNAGSNTAADQVAVVDEALGQLPREVAEEAELLVRADSAGLTHELLDFLHDANIRFSVGVDMTEDVRQAVLAIRERDWAPAVSADGEEREKALVAELDLDHRGHARVEDRIRCGKDTGMRNLPFREFAANEVWLELSLIAQDLVAWTKALALDGELARSEPKRLRYRLLHQAGRIARSGRRVRLRLERSWPWAQALVAALERIRALPAPAPP